MAILMTFEAQGMTADQYGQVNEHMGLTGDAAAPDGLLHHTACDTGSSILVVDVWESEAALNRFFEERLGAALAQAGVPMGEPRIEPVLNELYGPR